MLIAYVRIPPFVVTLGMLSVARSAAMVLSQNKMIYQFGPDEKLLFWLGGGSTFGIANPVIALVLLAVITGLLLKWTRWGCHVFAIGSNEKAAVLTGIAVRRLKVSVYMFSSLMAGIAGVLEAGWLGGVTTNLGQSMELSVIAATVIGGANLMGGAGTVFGSVVGAALIEVIRNSLTLLGISTFWQGAFVGSFIVLAVAFDRIRANRDRRLTQASHGISECGDKDWRPGAVRRSWTILTVHSQPRRGCRHPDHRHQRPCVGRQRDRPAHRPWRLSARHDPAQRGEMVGDLQRQPLSGARGDQDADGQEPAGFAAQGRQPGRAAKSAGTCSIATC